MLKIERFTSLARSYGANIDLWPVEVQADALSLLKISKVARTVLAEERLMDDALAAARRHQEISLWPPGERSVALVRLRTNVAARIAPAPSGPSRFGARLFAQVRGLWPHLNWLGISSGSGIAVAAGLFIGMHFPNLPASGDLLSTLQVASIPIFIE